MRTNWITSSKPLSYEQPDTRIENVQVPLCKTNLEPELNNTPSDGIDSEKVAFPGVLEETCETYRDAVEEAFSRFHHSILGGERGGWVPACPRFY